MTKKKVSTEAENPALRKGAVLPSLQFGLFDKKTPIETVFITPTKDMPFEVFKQCHHLAYFMELMEHLPDGRVIWDEEVTDIVDESMAEVEYAALQNDWFETTMELPKVFVERLSCNGA